MVDLRLFLTTQGKFQLVVKIKNRKSTFSEHLVDLIVEDWELPVTSEIFSQKKIRGLTSLAVLTLSARALCSEEERCQNCAKVCGEWLIQ
jgi:DNA-binding response OmpR family regulator